MGQAFCCNERIGGGTVYIVDDDRKYVVNVDNIKQIKLACTEINAYCVDSQMPYVLGRYKTPERAEEVFEELLAKAFPVFPNPAEIESTLSMTGAGLELSTKSDCACEFVTNPYFTYYMPKE